MHKRYTSKRKEKFNSNIVLSTRSAINSDMLKDRDREEKQDSLLLLYLKFPQVNGVSLRILNFPALFMLTLKMRISVKELAII